MIHGVLTYFSTPVRRRRTTVRRTAIRSSSHGVLGGYYIYTPQYAVRRRAVSSTPYGVLEKSMLSSKLTKRITGYLEKMPAAVSGESGHSQTFAVAKILVFGFGLSDSDALIFLRQYNQRCRPTWSEKELVHKIKSARKFGPGKQKSIL